MLFHFILIISFICSQISSNDVIDLDQSNQLNKSQISFYTLSNQHLDNNLLSSLFFHNPKTVIHIQETNNSIVPIDEIIFSTQEENSNKSNYHYLEIQTQLQSLSFSKLNYIPISPCISSNAFDLDAPLMGVAFTHRLIVSTRYIATLGESLSISGSLNYLYYYYYFLYLLNDTSLALNFSEKSKLKYAKQKDWDFFIACYSTHFASRLFGYLPLNILYPLTRLVIFDKTLNKVDISRSWIKHKPRLMMFDNSEPKKIICDVGTRQHLKCDQNKGYLKDKFGNELTWENKF
ncbi:hypothetical protein KGF54_002576 [Candida jiufengensis]|uniref:uncharacterized protein n=1 Tax=Candida jiufengensis TaxID=497108 RepID=UPI002225516D|nr:uncharacterized protein KGF54_002576 [Candida jiufengensis]KAI5953205.1 hypothetical protein KGF54_002576 [Candida jiufengensis]